MCHRVLATDLITHKIKIIQSRKVKATQILITSNNSPQEGTVHSCINSVKLCFPDLSHILYNGQEIQGLIKKNYRVDVLIAYQKLEPYAYKSDLARLCIVNIKGGWHFDVGYIALAERTFPQAFSS